LKLSKVFEPSKPSQAKKNQPKPFIMKFAAVALLAFIAAVSAGPLGGPISVSNNNVGDIVTVDVKANAVLSNNMEANIVTVLAALINQQAALIAGNGNTANLPTGETADIPELPKLPQLSDIKLSPEMIEKVKSFLSQN
jgi:hypothetical protein